MSTILCEKHTIDGFHLFEAREKFKDLSSLEITTKKTSVVHDLFFFSGELAAKIDNLGIDILLQLLPEDKTSFPGIAKRRTCFCCVLENKDEIYHYII